MKVRFTIICLFTLYMGVLAYLDFKDLKEELPVGLLSAEEYAEETKPAQKMAHIKLNDEDRSSYTTNITINGRYKIKGAIVDTGATITMLTYNDYITMKANGIISDDDFISKNYSVNSDNIQTLRHVYKIREMKVGDAVIRDCICKFNMENKASNMRLIGLNFLKKFKVRFDFQHNDMILEK